MVRLERTGMIGAVLIGLVGLFFFYDLGRFPIFQWDEARYVNNSLEVLTLGNWFHFTMDGAVDTWNFKPPLVLWLQAISMQLFGINEWAVRLPSALAGIGIAVLLYWFCVTTLESVWTGVATVLFYAASCGFISPHIGRSADLDAVQTFFVLWYVLLFLHYLVAERTDKYIFLQLGILVLLAFLCKGMPGLLLLPYLLIISCLPENYRRVFFNKSLYFYATLTMAACLAYYVLRELDYPGYWDLVKKSEFNRFSGKGVEWHQQPFNFYLKNFTEQKRYFFLIYLLPLTLLTFLTGRYAPTRRVFLYICLITLGYFLFISIPPIKLEWYDAPLYPLFALLFGIATKHGVESLAGRHPWWPLVMVALSLALCWPHYRYTWREIQYSPGKTVDFEREGLVMRQLSVEQPLIRDYTVFIDKRKVEHLDQVKFYQKAFAHDWQANILLKDKVAELHPGERVLVAQPRFADSIRLYFPAADTIFAIPEGALIRIN